MALLHKFWKLKASLLSTSVYKGEFLQGGRIKYIFGKETPSPLITRAAVSGSVSSAVGHLPPNRSFGFSFTKFFTSSRTSAAGHKPSTIFSIQYQALLSTKTLSCMFATSAIHCPLLRGRRYIYVEVATEFRGSNSLYLLTGQTLGGIFSQKEKTIAPKRVVDLKISGLQHVWNEHRLWGTYGVVAVKACKYKPKVFTSRDRYTLVMKGIGGFCEANEDSEVEEYAVGVRIHVLGMIFEKVTMQDCLDAQRVSSLSTAYHSFDPAPLESVVEDSYGSSAGKELLGLEFCGHHELRYSEDPSMNLDNEGVQHRSLRLLSGACCLPHPNKVKTGGEDAYFICSEEQVVGVADGVGGWADVGVDAGDYARELMLQSKLAVAQEPHGYIDPARVMIRAHARTKCRGSSTACILALSDYGLQAANLGDSGFMLIRNGRTIFKSPVQQHQFNIPYQLESDGSDPPSSAEVFSLQVAAGDVLVAGTDGLFDNLYDNELMGIVIHSTRAGLDPQGTAQKIASLARERAEDRDRQTPFSTAAQEAGFRFYGGKMDDITVIISYVTTIKSGFSNSLPNL